MKKLTAISLFSGIGLMDLAFVHAGFDLLAQVEIDPFCQHVLRSHRGEYWKDAKLFADVRKCRVGGYQRWGKIQRPDVVFGGPPCTNISVAGKQQGLAEGTASSLVFEFLRIVSELRPRIVLVENVRNIVHLGGTTVIGELARMGYDARWGIISAEDANFPHLRERWFCVAYSCGESWAEQEYPGTWNDADRKYDTPVSIAQGNHALPAIGCTGQDALSNANGARLEGEKRSESQKPGTTRYCGRGKELKAQSAMGGSVDGMPRWLSEYPHVARPCEAQKDHEAPRLTIKGTREEERQRKEWLKALGNGALPQVVYPLAVQIRRRLEQSP